MKWILNPYFRKNVVSFTASTGSLSGSPGKIGRGVANML